MTDKQASAAKRNVTLLQKAIVNGLENVKAQDIQVFDTEHITSLFERVIVASGTSNRQTKALAASVRDAVRQAGFDKPRTEGEDNGEWIIVDCGAAVAHIMQPSIRQYYHLEELWGDKPVRHRPATAPKTRAGVGGKAEPTKEPSASKKAVRKASTKAGDVASGKDADRKVALAGKAAVAGKPPVSKAPAAAKKSPASKSAGKSRPAVKRAVSASAPSGVAAPIKKAAAKPARKKVAAKSTRGA
jgi:ribosome-associated protein